MKKLLILLFIFILQKSSLAQLKLDTSIANTFLKCDEVMNQIKNEKYTHAMELLKPVSTITYEQIDTLASKMNYQLPYFIYRFGKIIGVDLIENKTIKDFLIQRTYVLRFEKYYARFEFILYKNLVGWAVLGFKYDDNISSLFK